MTDKPLTVVLQHDPETEEFDEDWSLLDIHGGHPAEPGDRSMSEIEWARIYIGETGLPGAFWDETPAEFRSARKILVRGCMESRRIGSSDYGDEYDHEFAIESERVLL